VRYAVSAWDFCFHEELTLYASVERPPLSSGGVDAVGDQIAWQIQQPKARPQ
jgi:hypothetical protein